jgi:hypothetical protein
VRSGGFDTLHLPPIVGGGWDVSQLYTTGRISVATTDILPGDYNRDRSVDAADYVIMRKRGYSDEVFAMWRFFFGQRLENPAGAGSIAGATEVPEPASLVLLILACSASLSRRGWAKPRVAS